MPKYMLYVNMFYPNSCYIQKRNMSECTLYTKICIVSKLCHIRKYIMSAPMLHANIRCVLSDLMLHTNIWYVRTYITNEKIMFSVRYYVAYDNVQCLNICYTRIWNVFYPSLWYIRTLRSNLCYIRKYDVFSRKCCYLRQYYKSELMLPANIFSCLLSKLSLYTIMCNVRT